MMISRSTLTANMPADFKEFPVSRYEWLTVSIDVFLARYISVVDCPIILVSEILECGLLIEACTPTNLKKPVQQAILWIISV